MTLLLILSRDADQYRHLVEQAKLADLVISQSVKQANEVDLNIEHAILLADPDLAAQILPLCPHIQWVQSTWAGVKPIIDLNLPDIKLTGIKGLFGSQMQEYVFTYILHFARQVQNYQALQQQKRWIRSTPEGLTSKRIGILGVGSIGLEVAKTAKHFNMQVIGVSRNAQNQANIDEQYTMQQAAQFAPTLDYLVSLLPHTNETQHLINDNFLTLLPAHCVFINAGRGQVVDELALCGAMSSGKLKAAVLDVFNHEPLPQDHPFWELENVMITQHSAAISHPKDIVRVFIDNYQRLIHQQTLLYEIDWSLGY